MKSLDGRAARTRSNALGWGNAEGTEGSLRQNSEKHVEQRRVDRPIKCGGVTKLDSADCATQR